MAKVPVEQPRASLDDVQSPITGFVGLSVALLGHILLSTGVIHMRWGAGVGHWYWRWRYGLILVAALVAMALVELVFFRVHRRHFDFDNPRHVDRAAVVRIAKRWVAFTSLILICWGLYCVLRVYRADQFLMELVGTATTGDGSEFSPFFLFFLVLTPLLVVFSPVYFFVIERNVRLLDPKEDELLLAFGVIAGLTRLSVTVVLSLFVRRRQKQKRVSEQKSDLIALVRDPRFTSLLRSMVVKFFFLPLMVIWYLNAARSFDHNLSGFISACLNSTVEHDVLTRRGYLLLFQGTFLLDLSLAAIGYTFTLRLFDTHVRSAEPTLLGWAVTLACYAPFNEVANMYLDYGGGQRWFQFILETPIVSVLWGLAILLLIGIYLLATMMFGLRFSNLTNRGILSRGPYAFVRHPAYIAKNLSWWLMAVPFLRDFSSCLLLLGWNLLYVIRAYTEEAHLGVDPHYQQYREKVRWRFVPRIW